MIHYGDITKLSGFDLPVVDVITGGSPCQDLSVAGKRAGLAGERSGLFMEQIRIVKEMRERDVRENGRSGFLVRPRYMVWENVPGAFSSNKGADFQVVLSEIIKIAEPNAPDVPMPEKGKWSKSGCLYDELGRWSVAWRVHDAQFWGVPQRRKRISLVADFGGRSATEILFERSGLSRNPSESRKEKQDSAGAAKESIGEPSKCLNSWDVQSKHIQTADGIAECLYAGEKSWGGGQSYVFCLQGGGTTSQNSQGSGYGQDTSFTLNAVDVHGVAYSFDSLSSNSMKSSNPNSGCRQVDVAKTLDCFDPNPAKNQGGIAIVFENHSQDSRYKQFGEICETVSAKYGTGGNNQPLVTYQDVTGTLNPGGHPGSYNGQDAYNDMLIAAVDCRNSAENGEVNASLQASAYKNTNSNNILRVGSMVRRLTPLECERLQGFPDGWTDIGEWVDSKGKKHKEADSPRYKALGNSIALPFWKWLARRICAQYERQVTMASLFDGIGGFPLSFQAAGAVPVWASEIEEFPIAVTKYHFPEKEI